MTPNISSKLLFELKNMVVMKRRMA